MNIESITLEHTNPSLGPHETVTVVTLTQAKSHRARIHDFINMARVNGVVTLYEYIEAVQAQDSKVLDEVQKNAPNSILTTGGTISNLSIEFKDADPVRLYDVYRRFRVTHFYPEFTSYMVEHGTKISHQPHSRF